MSWDAQIEVRHPDGYITIVELFNCTYNLRPMWEKAGIYQTFTDIQDAKTVDLGPKLLAGLTDAIQHPQEYRALNPPNGWGNYEGFVELLVIFARACYEHPTGIVRVH